jgi:hypothetical protein
MSNELGTTDKQASITFMCSEACTYTLNFPAFFSRSKIQNCAKIFAYMMEPKYDIRNWNAISYLDENLPLWVSSLKDDWALKSKVFQNEWQTVDRNFIYDISGPMLDYEIRKRKANNNRLAKSVKHAKHEYEHALKVLDSYTNARTKFIKRF